MYMYFLDFTSITLGLLGVLPKDTPRKNPEGPAWLEPGVSRLQVTHFTAEQCRMPFKGGTIRVVN